jgi:hypothetical protein
LPRDFQATLDLLYDGDKPKPVVIEPPQNDNPPVEASNTMISNDGPHMIMAEDLSQHSMLYGNFYPTSAEISVPPPPKIDEEKSDSVEMIDEEDNKKNQEDMDDLAMLGIDVNDVGSGLW